MKIEPVVIENGMLCRIPINVIHGYFTNPYANSFFNYGNKSVAKVGNELTIYVRKNRHIPPKVFSWEEFKEEVTILKLLG